MPAVEVSHIVKSFADEVAVDDLSFSVVQGEKYLGLLAQMVPARLPPII